MTVRFGFDVEPKGLSPGLIEQIHGNTVLELNPNWPEKPTADGVFTSQLDTTIYVFTADCLPLLLYSADPAGPIAAVHSGWRGAMLRIPEVTLTLLKDWSPSLHAVLGPCLLPCCFEIKQDFIEIFATKDAAVKRYITTRDRKMYFDLPQYVIEQQLRPSLSRDRIDVSYMKCTFCSGLPSFRRNGSTNPRIKANLIRTA